MSPRRDMYATTEALKSITDDLLKNEGEEARLSVYEKIDEMQESYREMKKKYPVINVIYSMLSHVDKKIEKHKEKFPSVSSKIKCTKRCFGCCKQAVTCSEDEALLLYNVLREDNIKIDREKMRRQSPHTMKTWLSQSESDLSCIFLSSHGNCKVYEYRPFVCRSFLSLSDPRNCDPGNGVAKIKRFIVPSAEMTTAAVWNESPTGTLPYQLEKLFNKEQE